MDIIFSDISYVKKWEIPKPIELTRYAKKVDIPSGCVKKLDLVDCDYAMSWTLSPRTYRLPNDSAKVVKRILI